MTESSSSSSTELILEVNVPQCSITKKMKFSSNLTVQQTLEMVVEKFAAQKFIDETNPQEWLISLTEIVDEALIPLDTLASLNLRNNDKLFFQKIDSLSPAPSATKAAVVPKPTKINSIKDKAGKLFAKQTAKIREKVAGSNSRAASSDEPLASNQRASPNVSRRRSDEGAPPEASCADCSASTSLPCAATAGTVTTTRCRACFETAAGAHKLISCQLLEIGRTQYFFSDQRPGACTQCSAELSRGVKVIRTSTDVQGDEGTCWMCYACALSAAGLPTTTRINVSAPPVPDQPKATIKVAPSLPEKPPVDDHREEQGDEDDAGENPMMLESASVSPDWLAILGNAGISVDQLKNPVVVNAIVASLAESGVLVKTKIVEDANECLMDKNDERLASAAASKPSIAPPAGLASAAASKPSIAPPDKLQSAAEKKQQPQLPTPVVTPPAVAPPPMPSGAAAPSAGRAKGLADDMMGAIRRGKQLRRVSMASLPSAPKDREAGTLTRAIVKAMEKRRPQLLMTLREGHDDALDEW